MHKEFQVASDMWYGVQSGHSSACLTYIIYMNVKQGNCLKSWTWIKQQADGLMLSGESAMGQYPEKALAVLRSVSLRIERWWREEKHNDNMELPDIACTSLESVSEEICHAATKMANKLEADALFVYTKTGHMASLLSRCRPDCPVFAFTPSPSSQRRLNLHWGLIPFCLSFTNDMESNLDRSFSLLKARGMIKSGDLIISVSDMLQSVQVVNVP